MPGLGAAIRIRTVRPGDDDVIRELLGGLDPEASYRRWFTGAVNLKQAVEWAAHPDRFSAVGLLALADGHPVGHGVLIPCGDGRAEIAFEVAEPWRCHGIATALLQKLLDASSELGLREVYADVLCENHDMLVVLREHGEHSEKRDGGVVTLTIPVPLRRPTPAETPPLTVA
jgi:acetyltransferase